MKNVSIEELPSIYALANVFVYPSLFEGFGIPIIESLASGTPVITTKGGCFSEAGGPNSIYINPLDYEELAFNIDHLLTKSDLQNKMSLSGKKFVKKFNPKELSNELMKTYRSII